MNLLRKWKKWPTVKTNAKSIRIYAGIARVCVAELSCTFSTGHDKQCLPE